MTKARDDLYDAVDAYRDAAFKFASAKEPEALRHACGEYDAARARLLQLVDQATQAGADA